MRRLAKSGSGLSDVPRRGVGEAEFVRLVVHDDLPLRFTDVQAIAVGRNQGLFVEALADAPRHLFNDSEVQDIPFAAEIPLVVAITEGIPVADMVKVRRALAESSTRRRRKNRG